MFLRAEDTEDQEDELLSLSLAIITDPGGEKNRKRKRSRLNIVSNTQKPLNDSNNNSSTSSSYEGYNCEGKIFKLLQVREEMLKLDQKRKGVVEDGKGLHLIHLLLITATSVDENNVNSALENLTELYQSVSLMGDSVQRVVAYFADGLAARLLTRKSPFYDMIIKEPTNEEEFLAFTCLYRVSPYYQFAHFTANQAILEAFERDEDINNRALHVIDFDVSYGFQWPSLIQSLSEKATSGNRISFRLTGYGRNLEELQETETRLVSFAKGFRNLVFEFQGLLRGSKLINLRKRKNETVAVNLVFHLNTLNNLLKISDTLKSIHSLKPSIVILVEQEGSRSPRSFLSRFMESLHYFAAMFDSLDDCLPLESGERLSIEKNHLGKEIKSMVNCDNKEEEEDDDDEADQKKSCPRYEKMETWKGRMESHGFEGLKLGSKCLIQAKLLLKIRTHYCPLQCEGDQSGGFRVFERDDGKALSLGWQDRCLLTASAWQCV
ncbi:Transcription factor GRAS [Corchorus olitorius]|uniref:Transcription factor GRAS n=1 Tax=Corchorus olitorius TaxID=93759 RepID=A0A1R3GF89_9ROSI|nr:Transcription factor GRAS [Corchorus olitorius]